MAGALANCSEEPSSSQAGCHMFISAVLLLENMKIDEKESGDGSFLKVLTLTFCCLEPQE